MNTLEVFEADLQNPAWGDDAPKGGKAVLNRIIKEKATVPLFFGQTLIQSLRDVGYNSTTSALCEHVDNAIQWGASEIRIYFSQNGKRGDYEINVLVLDNGKGMAPNVLKVATSFGGSMVYGNRSGIGRYGMGMKTAALSMSPVMDLYSWQEPGVIYNMTLDVDAIGKEKANLIELAEPNLLDELPSRITEIITKPMIFPDSGEQALLTSNPASLHDMLGSSGTIVYMPMCDRLTAARARTLVDHAVREMSRIYRKFLEKGLQLFVNNRQVEAFDPTYWMTNARHTRIPELTIQQSRLVLSKPISIRLSEYTPGVKPEDSEKGMATLRLYALPIEDWGPLPLKVRKNDLHLYDDHTVSFMRNDREVFIGTVPEIVKRHADANWFRIQVDFSGELDEAFGVASNKQGVRPKKYVLEEISKALSEEITALRDQIRRHQSEQTFLRQGKQQTSGEAKADEAEGFQVKPLLDPSPTTPEEQEQLDSNLRTLSMMLKRDSESDEDAYERVKSSRHIIHYKHDDYWPFYHVDQRFGKIILTINTAHPFYRQLYEPLSRAASMLAAAEGVPNDVEEKTTESQTFVGAEDALTALQLMLLSLARAQSSMALQAPDRKQLFDQFRKEWSETYQTQLTAP
jgi:hypothetical protein